MRLAILISVCVLIATFSIGSIILYRSWKKNRYDTLILEAATEHGLHPALLKALMDARGHFTYYTRGAKGEAGLLQVPQEGIREYKKTFHGNEDYDLGWVCLNKDHAPHDPVITYDLSRTCNICRSPLIRGEYYPKKNIEMGAWYLATLKASIEEATEPRGGDITPLVVAAYSLSEKTVRDATDNYTNPNLPPRIRNSIHDVLVKLARYKRKGLK